MSNIQLGSVVITPWDIQNYNNEKDKKIIIISAGGCLANGIYRGIAIIVATALALVAISFIGMGIGSVVLTCTGAFSAGEAICGILFFTIPCFVLAAPSFAKASFVFYRLAFQQNRHDDPIPTWKTLEARCQEIN